MNSNFDCCALKVWSVGKFDMTVGNSNTQSFLAKSVLSSLYHPEFSRGFPCKRWQEANEGL